MNGNDLISRAAAHEMVKGLQKWCITLPGNPRITQVGYMSDDVRFGLDRLPVVDAAPVVHAEWVADGPGLTCSACQEWVDSEVYYMLSPRQNPTYCPYCGAKMDGEAT